VFTPGARGGPSPAIEDDGIEGIGRSVKDKILFI